jgi:glycosyltransferase involved in cell wall biosynthesis
VNKQKIKLFICIPTLQCGGSEKYVHTICKYIDKDKFEVTLLVLYNKNPFYAIDPAVELIDLQTARARHAVSKIIQLARERKPDVLFSVASHVNILLAMFRNRFPTGMVLIARESSLLSANSRYAAMPLLFNKLAKLFYSRIDHVICQSAAMQQDLADAYRMPAANTTVLLNPVEVARDTAADPTPLKFITVARLSKEKGIGRILEALALLSLPYHFHVIGEGKERIALEALAVTLGIKEKVTFHGRQPKPFNDMEDAQLFLMGSYHEGLPNALLEAGAYGIPAVAYDAPGGIGEIINEANGLLVKDDSPGAFAQVIEQAISLPFHRQTIQTQTVERFSVTTHLQALEALLNRLAASK